MSFIKVLLVEVIHELAFILGTGDSEVLDIFTVSYLLDIDDLPVLHLIDSW